MNCRVRPAQAPRPWSSASSLCRRGNRPGVIPMLAGTTLNIWSLRPSPQPKLLISPIHMSASLGLRANRKIHEYEGSIRLYFFAIIKQKHSLLAKAGSDRAWQPGSVSLNREHYISIDSGRDILCLLHVKGAFLCGNKITAVKLLTVNIGQSSPQASDT